MSSCGQKQPVLCKSSQQWLKLVGSGCILTKNEHLWPETASSVWFRSKMINISWKWLYFDKNACWGLWKLKKNIRKTSKWTLATLTLKTWTLAAPTFKTETLGNFHFQNTTFILRWLFQTRLCSHLQGKHQLWLGGSSTSIVNFNIRNTTLALSDRTFKL